MTSQVLEQHNSKSHQQALKALEKKDFRALKLICEDALLTEPSALPFIQLHTHALIQIGELDKAKQQVIAGLKIHPDHPALYEDLGSIEALQGNHTEAINAYRKSIQINPKSASIHKKLSQALINAGEYQQADEAFLDFLDRDKVSEKIALGAEHWRAGRIDEAIDDLQAAVRQAPDNVNALRFLAMAYIDKNKTHDAEALLRKAISIAPDYTQAIQDLGRLLLSGNNWQEAINTFQLLVQAAPDDALAWGSLANAYAREGDCEKAIAHYKKSLAINPDIAGHWMTLAHQLKTIGAQDEALDSYRKSIVLKPDMAESYWSMANLKTFKFSNQEIAAMEEQLLKPELDDEKTVHFHFSLGKAYEDKQAYARAWEHYHEGNQLQRTLTSYDPVQHETLTDNLISIFTDEFVAQHQGQGNPSTAPVFIVGLPRSGSTLIEQILASHSQVEGTAELPNINITALSTAKYRQDNKQYPQTITDFNIRDWKYYGKEYLEQVSHHRVENKPFFIDKLPNNFIHIGWIKMILPNAKIIITRRHPIDSCLGAYKQLFAKGQDFTYDMFELAEYYQNFVRICEHWKAVFPGQIHEVHYEDTVENFDEQVRGLLDYCGLPFEEQCLKFYETKRAVKTASSEQVRSPIYKTALGLWKKYDNNANLDLWKEELADIIAGLPESVKRVSN